MSAKVLSFHLPNDTELLAALGRVAVRHGQLEYMLRMLIKSLRGLEIEEAKVLTKGWPVARLRTEVLGAGAEVLPEGTGALAYLEVMVEKAQGLSDLRNKYLHSVWASELDGDDMLLDVKANERLEVPNPGWLNSLAHEIEVWIQQINTARLEGEIADELAHRKEIKALLKDSDG